MKKYRNFIMLLAVASLIAITGCGKEDEATPQEKTQDAISGSKAVSVSGSTIPADAPITSAGAFFNVDAASGAVTFTTTGDVTAWVSGGSFTVDAEGNVTGVTITPAAESDLEVSSASGAVDLAASTLTLSFTTGPAAGARTAGIGSWALVFSL